jgi:hypothetical protein
VSNTGSNQKGGRTGALVDEEQDKSFEGLLVVSTRNRPNAGCAEVVHVGLALQAGPCVLAQQACTGWHRTDSARKAATR